MRKTIVIVPIIITTLLTSPAFAQNRVLSLDGDGDYVQLPANIFNHLSEATVEGWLRFESLAYMTPFFDFGRQEQNMVVHGYFSHYLTFYIYDKNKQRHTILVNGIPTLKQWCHIAVVSGKTGMKLYFNGVLVGENDFTGSFAAIGNGDNNYLGAFNDLGEFSPEGRVSHLFHGQMDEVWVWSVARTQEEIQSTMYSILSDNEPGLVGYWRFDNAGKIATDSSPNHWDGKLAGDAQFVETKLPKPGELVIPAALSGVVTDEAGKLLSNVSVRLVRDGEAVASAKTDALGIYHMAIFRPSGSYDLSATWKNLGGWQFSITLHEGKHKTVNFTLKEAISIQGTLLMLDDKTPHVAVPVQAIRDGQVIDGVSSDEDGRYQFINLKPGRYQVRCYIPGEYVYFGGKASAKKGAILHVKAGKTLRNINFQFVPFKKGMWRTYTYLDGLTHDSVSAIYRDADDVMWFGTQDGVSRYDGEKFVNLTTKDGLPNSWVNAIYGAPDGMMWFATGDWWGGFNGAVSRYDGREFIHFTTQDGLAHNRVHSIHGAPDGVMWFGTEDGVSRYDGKRFKNFTTRDGLADNWARYVHGTPDGVMWFGTDGGISR